MNVPTTIPVYFNGSTAVALCPGLLTQNDYGQKLLFADLDLPDAYEVFFSNIMAGGTAKPQLGDSTGVTIPDENINGGNVIYAWLFLHAGEDDGRTMRTVSIPVTAASRHVETPPTPVQQGVIDQAIAALQAAEREARLRVSSLSDTPFAIGSIIEAVGIPTYLADVSEYSAYGITEPGWYVFARVNAKSGVTVTEQTTVTGATGHIATVGADHIDVAVRFEVAAVSHAVTIDWGASSDTYVFKATDLATRNLDYRTTFYVYDLSPYATWTYALTTDETFATGKHYFTESGGVYTEAREGTDWTAGDAIPADTYYNHSGLTLSGMVKNVTYRLDAPVDCGITVILPEIDDDGHGAWFEFQLRHTGSFSITLTPPTGVKGATAGASAAITAGLNVADLHYTDVDGEKMWSLANVHTNIPT